MKRLLIGLTAAACIISLYLPLTADAARKPVITSHDETYVNRSVRFRVTWQAENPVVALKIFTGKEQKEIKVDEYDNRRTRDGYSGEVSTVVELDPSFMEPTMAYVIQLEDDVRLKSDPINGKIAVGSSMAAGAQPYGGVTQQFGGVTQQFGGVTQQFGGTTQQFGGTTQQFGGTTQQFGGVTQPYGAQPMDMNSQGMTGTQPMGGVQVSVQPSSTVQAINQVAGLMSAIDLPPNVGKITVAKMGNDAVAINVQVNDDKGLAGVSVKILDASGNIVQQDNQTPTGKMWNGASKFYNLVNGNYSASIQATDSTGNSSPDKFEAFVITGSSATAMPATTTDSQSTTDPWAATTSTEQTTTTQ